MWVCNDTCYSSEIVVTVIIDAKQYNCSNSIKKKKLNIDIKRIIIYINSTQEKIYYFNYTSIKNNIIIVSFIH